MHTSFRFLTLVVLSVLSGWVAQTFPSCVSAERPQRYEDISYVPSSSSFFTFHAVKLDGRADAFRVSWRFTGRASTSRADWTRRTPYRPHRRATLPRPREVFSDDTERNKEEEARKSGMTILPIIDGICRS